MTARILLVDDDSDTRMVFRDKLTHAGYEVEEVESAEAALGCLTAFDPAVVITDIHMGGMTGLELLGRVREAMPSTEVIVMTGHEDMGSAVTAMKSGAYEYLVKPVSLGRLEAVVERCVEERKLGEGIEERPEGEETVLPPGTVVGRDPHMIEIFKTIGALARNRTTVLIRGETGTGKEMVARAVHENSDYSDEPFVAVNCTALTDTLLESELFGHVKGAFTGAVGGRKGYFELAGKGTIFLDEIGDTSPDFQTKLLRVLQERQFYPVGGEEARVTEARVIAATHQPMEELVQEGGFREDLYFRLRVVELRVPALRERPGDVPLLADHLLTKIRSETGQDVRHIADEAMKMLEDYSWPGNVRELENALTRAAILARGNVLGPDHFSLGLQQEAVVDSSAQPAPSGGESLDEVIAAHVRKTLAETGANKTEAARRLGISRSRLARYLDKFGDSNG